MSGDGEHAFFFSASNLLKMLRKMGYAEMLGNLRCRPYARLSLPLLSRA